MDRAIKSDIACGIIHIAFYHINRIYSKTLVSKIYIAVSCCRKDCSSFINCCTISRKYNNIFCRYRSNFFTFNISSTAAMYCWFFSDKYITFFYHYYIIKIFKVYFTIFNFWLFISSAKV